MFGEFLRSVNEAAHFHYKKKSRGEAGSAELAQVRTKEDQYSPDFLPECFGFFRLRRSLTKPSSRSGEYVGELTIELAPPPLLPGIVKHQLLSLADFPYNCSKPLPKRNPAEWAGQTKPRQAHRMGKEAIEPTRGLPVRRTRSSISSSAKASSRAATSLCSHLLSA